MLYKTFSAAVYGIDANIIEVEVDVSGDQDQRRPLPHGRPARCRCSREPRSGPLRSAQLTAIRQLRVVSRTSSMHFKETQLSVPEICKQLRVDAIVEGSVIREGNHIRVHAQLIRELATSISGRKPTIVK